MLGMRMGPRQRTKTLQAGQVQLRRPYLPGVSAASSCRALSVGMIRAQRAFKVLHRRPKGSASLFAASLRLKSTAKHQVRAAGGAQERSWRKIVPREARGSLSVGHRVVDPAGPQLDVRSPCEQDGKIPVVRSVRLEPRLHCRQRLIREPQGRRQVAARGSEH